MRRGVVETGAVVLAIAFAACGGQTEEQRNRGSGAGGGDAGTTPIGGAAGMQGGAPGFGGTAGVIGGLGGARDAAAGFGNNGCGNDLELDTSPAIDIVLALDTSSTMSEEVVALERGLNAFVDRMVIGRLVPRLIALAGNPPGLGPTLCVPSPLGSGSCARQGSDTILPQYFHHQTAIVGSDDALNVVYATFADYAPYLRTGSAKTVLVVSDGNATAPPYGSADAFIDAFSALAPELLEGWSFSALHAFDECPGTRSVGSVYDEIANRRLRASFEGNLCVVAADELLVLLADHLVSVTPAVCSWEVPSTRPGGRPFDFTKVNLELLVGGNSSEIVFHVGLAEECEPARGGWYYDSRTEPKRIKTCPATCEQIRNRETRVILRFGCSGL